MSEKTLSRSDNTTKTRKLAEGALMLALATVLQFVTVIKMPFGGDVTAFCMLPIILIAYRYGTAFGLTCGFAYSLIQMLLGMNNLQYGTSFLAVVAIILFDYVLAFTSTGLGGIFRNSKLSQSKALAYGTVIICAIRLFCHFMSGCTVWAVWAPEGMPVWQYSLLYNSAYMIPETVITVAVAVWLSGFIDLKSPTLVRKSSAEEQKKKSGNVVFSTLSSLFAIAAVVVDILHIFSTIQSEAGFDFSLIKNVNPVLLICVTLAGAVLAAAFKLIPRVLTKKAE